MLPFAWAYVLANGGFIILPYLYYKINQKTLGGKQNENY